MRLAYISLHWPRLRTGSVGAKIQRQIKAWQEAGHEVRFFMHTAPYQPAGDLLPGEIATFAGSNFLARESARMAAAGRLVSTVEAFRPDLIYLRYGMYVHPLHLLGGIAPFVEDITTNDLIQHRSLGPLYSIYNRLTRSILFNRAKGIVSVSHELAVSPAFARFGIPTLVIANGIDLDGYATLPAPNNSTPRLVFLGTPTTGFDAHGLDKIVKLAELCPDLNIDIVGYNGFPQGSPLPANIRFHGLMDAKRFLPVLATADVALSSMAFHRVGMNEASPLKSREYLAYGLPMVVPYKDTDLDDLEVDFFLKIPNREDNVETHASAIRDFAYRMRGRRVERALITPRIDSQAKEKKRLEFFRQILSDSQSKAAQGNRG